jgi:hypothetical protein
MRSSLTRQEVNVSFIAARTVSSCMRVITELTPHLTERVHAHIGEGRRTKVVCTLGQCMVNCGITCQVPRRTEILVVTLLVFLPHIATELETTVWIGTFLKVSSYCFRR